METNQKIAKMLRAEATQLDREAAALEAEAQQRKAEAVRFHRAAQHLRPDRRRRAV